MKYFQLFSLNCGLIFSTISLFTQHTSDGHFTVSENKTAISFSLSDNTESLSFYFDKADAKVVQIAAAAFAGDMKVVTGKKMLLTNAETLGSTYSIVAGTIGQSKIIDELIKNKLLDVTAIKNKWECFTIQIIKDNSKFKDTKALRQSAEAGGLLVIAGSDMRGKPLAFFIYRERALYFYFGLPKTTDSKEQYSRPAVDNVF